MTMTKQDQLPELFEAECFFDDNFEMFGDIVECKDADDIREMLVDYLLDTDSDFVLLVTPGNGDDITITNNFGGSSDQDTLDKLNAELDKNIDDILTVLGERAEVDFSESHYQAQASYWEDQHKTMLRREV